MAETSLTVVPAHSPIADGLRHLLRMMDRPVRSALELGARPPAVIVGVAAVGGFLVASAGMASAALAGFSPGVGVRAAFEALFIVIPSSVVLGAYVELRPSPSAMFASAAISLLTAGVVCWSLIPLVAFVLLATQGAGSVDFVFQLLIPAVAVMVVALGVQHFFKVTDPRSRAQWLGASIVVLVAVLFLIRLDSLFFHVLGGPAHGHGFARMH